MSIVPPTSPPSADARITAHSASHSSLLCGESKAQQAGVQPVLKEAKALSTGRLVQNGNGQWVEDFSTSPPLLVPVLSLGQRVVATEGIVALSGSYSFAAASPAAGRSALRTIYLSSEMFEVGEVTGLQIDLMEMKLAELKEELESRGEPKTGNKPWLRRRLHAALVREHLSRMEEDDL